MKKVLVLTVLLLTNLSAALAADTEIAYNKAMALFEQNQRAQAIEIWRELSEQGHLMSIYRLGNMYQNGTGVARDYTEAMRLYQVAAAQDLPEALTEIAAMYFNGQGVGRDYEQGFNYALKGAELDNANSQFFLAERFDRGDVVGQSYKQAAKWYGRASDNGSDYARYRLAMFYARGLGVETDIEKAYELLKSAAADGSSAATEELADATFNNVGIILDHNKDGYDLALQGIEAWLENGGRSLCADTGIDSAHDLFWAPYTPTPRISKTGNAALSAYGGCLVGLQAALQWSVGLVDQDRAKATGALPISEGREGQVKYKCRLRPDHFDVAVTQARSLEHLEVVLWSCPIEIADTLQALVDTVEGGDKQVADASSSSAPSDDISAGSPLFNLYMQSRLQKSPGEATQEETRQILEELTQIKDLADAAKNQELHLDPDIEAQLQLQEAAVLAQVYAARVKSEKNMSDEELRAHIDQIKPADQVPSDSVLLALYFKSRANKSVAEASVEEYQMLTAELADVMALADEARSQGLADQPSFVTRMKLHEMAVLAQHYHLQANAGTN